MAAIDKIYGNSEQYFEFRNWAEGHCTWILMFFRYKPKYVSEQLTKKRGFVLTHLSCLANMYLLGNCPIEWVRRYIRVEQYDEEYLKDEYLETVDFKELAEEYYLKAVKEHEVMKDSMSHIKPLPIPEDYLAWRSKGYPLLD